MYVFYFKVGYVCNEKDYYYVKDIFNFWLLEVSYDQFNFWGKVYYCKVFYWFYYMIQDFLCCYCYSECWFDLF